MFEETNRVIGSHTSKWSKEQSGQKDWSTKYFTCRDQNFCCIYNMFSENRGDNLCSLICNYLCNHYLSPLMMWVRCGVRVTRSLVLCVCFIDHCLSFCIFSFGHCVVCSSSIYEFWLPLWYLQSLLRIRVLLIFLIILITGQTAVIFHWII
jgi:hypothetical protein